MSNAIINSPKSILASLRSLIPRCQLTFDDTRDLAERQAAKLVALLASDGSGLDEQHLTALPRLRIVRDRIDTSGLSYWNGVEWIVVISEEDSPVRQRFTVFHELKHIIDHYDSQRLYGNEWEREKAADYFAACALMPKPALKRAFCNLTQDRSVLAEYFGVSVQALRVRLEQTGLVDPERVTRRARCARPIKTPHWSPQRFRVVHMKGSQT